MAAKPTYEELEQKVKELEKQVFLHRQMGDELTSETEEPNHSMVLENPHLVDDKYSIKDLIDIEDLRKILETFSRATGFTTGFVEYPSQEILIATGWRDVCTKFHRAFPESVKHCKESNIYLTEQLKELKELSIKPCENGLVDGATPIVIKGKHLASLFTGQILFEKPDMARFKKQAKVYGYDSGPYLEALNKVPVVNEDQFSNALSFLKELAVTIGETGLHNLEQREKSSKLKKEIISRKRVEDALKESEKKYRALIENAGEVVLVAQYGRFKFANRKVFDLLGYKPEELIGKPFVDYIHPEDKVTVLERHVKRMDGEDLPGVYHFRVIDRSGETKWVEINAIRIEWEGKPSTLNFLADITERKQAEEKLQKSEKRLKGIFESIPSPIVVYNTEGHPLYLNPAFTALFHWSLDELKGQRIPFVPDDQKELSARKIGAVYKTGKVVNYETRRLTKQGDVLDVIVSGAFVTGSDGKPAEMVAVITNVTDLKRAKEALRESEEKYRTVLEANPDPVVVYDMEGRVIYLNPAFTRVFGWSLEEQIGKKIDDFVPEKNMSETRKMINKVTLAGESFSGIETRRYTKEGNILDISISGSCYKDHEGNVAASVINLRDITEQKRLEVQLQKARKMEAMGLMAGGVAHDLNNILSGIVSYPELLLMDLPEDSPLRKPIKTIQESGMRASDVVEDLMTIARGVATAKDALNLNTIVTEYLGSAEHRRLEKTHTFINFKTALAPDLLNINGSPTHINKTLMNLVTNASEAIEGGGTVTISTVNQYIEEPLMGYEDVHTGEYALLSVSDDGSGITPKDLERIFEPFYTKKVMGKSGTGLGLAVVWNTVQDHNGYVNVKSNEKRTVFELYFPVIRQEVAAEKENIPLEDYLGHGEKILVVDDEARQREIACGMLTKLGYTAEAVSSGQEAIEYVKDHPVDLIVLDMVMPKGINGLELYEEIIKIHPGQKAIIASGYAKTKSVDIAQGLGAGKYIKKPYILEKIGTAIKKELEQ